MRHGGHDPSSAQAALSSFLLDDAADGETAGRLAVPLWNRVLDGLGVRASRAGGAIAVLLIGVLLLREAALGRLAMAVADPPDLHVYLSVVDALLVGYLIAARVSVARAARATFDRLGDALDVTPAEGARLRGRMGSYRRGRFLAAGAAAALLGFLAPLMIRDGTIDPWHFAAWNPELAVRRSLAPVVGWLFGTYLLATIREAARVSALARRLRSIDLFDCETVAPFSRFGLQVAFLAAGLVSLSALMVTERGFGHVVALLVAIAAIAAAAGLVLPLRGLRERIREEKQRELACCREALRRARDAMVEGRSVTTEHGRLSEVVAYKQLVEAIDEWPIDTPTVFRAGGYVVLPVLSWFSGSVAPSAVVRLVEVLLQ